MTASMRILIAGGGTGGHVVPSLATAAALRELEPDVEVEFIGTSAGLEARLVPEAGWPLHLLSATALARRASLSLLRLPLSLAASARAARRLLAGPPPAAAAAVFGGYVSAPLALAAAWARVPLVVHEQNAIPGVANRMAARWSHSVAVSFSGTRMRLGRRRRAVVTGNPVRSELAGADPAALRGEALAAFDLDPQRRTLLVFGGSQGAQRINEAAVAAAALWPAPERLQILHAAGAGGYARARAAWEASGAQEAGLVVRCVEYVDRMDLAYAAADVAVCRAGASTVGELAVMGVPAVLVPYPHATADHQMANARALATAGGAIVVPDPDLDGATLVAAAGPLLDEDARREATARAARAFGRPDAALRVAELILDAAASPRGRRRRRGRVGDDDAIGAGA